MSAKFVHLHLHTEYSLVDSVVRVKNLMQATAEARSPAVAMTDQGNLFAMVKFYRAAMQHGLKPIIGTDIWLRNGADESEPSRLILLCRDIQGYQNLSRLLTRMYLEGLENGLPVARREWLDSKSVAGLMALSGARQGAIGRDLLAGRAAEAALAVEQFRELFAGDFFLELQRTGRSTEEEYNELAVELAAASGCPIVATNDVRFLRKEDFEAHEARVCIQQSRILSDKDRPRDYSEQQYLRSEAEMVDLFPDLPEALENSVEIARRCNLTLTLGETHLPVYAVPDGFTTDEFLTEEAEKGLARRLVIDPGNEFPEIYENRLRTDLSGPTLFRS